MRFEGIGMELIELYVKDAGRERLDSYLAGQLDDLSRTYIHKLIKEGLILVNGQEKKPRYIVKENDFIQIKLPIEEEMELVPQDLPLDIVYEDEYIAIINKAKGMVVHPGAGNYSSTLVNALLYRMDSLSSVSGHMRPGIVHRLDKDTSGLLIVAKNDEAHIALAKQLKERRVKRVYWALVYGVVDIDEGTINAPIGRHPVDRKRMAVTDKNSKEAITHFKVLERFKDYTLIEATLETGRTHQIRVHMAYIKHPIVGDQVYTRRKNEFGIDSQVLHAKKLGFLHPTKDKYMEFEVEPPKYFMNIINLLRKR